MLFAVEDWPDHVTFDNEQNWIVVDDTTLKRPPRHSKNLLAQSCPSNSMKVCTIVKCIVYSNGPFQKPSICVNEIASFSRAHCMFQHKM